MDTNFKVTEVELVYRNVSHPNERVQVTGSQSAYEILLQSWNSDKIQLVEQFKILLMDYRQNCLGVSEIASGGMASCVADTRIVFSTALVAKAAKIILAHNHPSGHSDPSDADIAITTRLAFGGNLLDIEVVDHLIVTPLGYYSLADNNKMPPKSALPVKYRNEG